MLDIHGIEQLKESLIPPGLICEELITDKDGSPICKDCEDWIRELVNCSSVFMERTHQLKFHAPDDESEGQADAITDYYSIDFKRILGQSAQQVVREYSHEMICFNGAIFTCVGRRHGSAMGIRLHAVLRDYSLDQLRALNEKADAIDALSEPDRDVACFLHSINKPKNLLLVLPVLIYADDGMPIRREAITNALHREFGNTASLFFELHPSKELFIAYFCEGCFVIVEAGKTEFRDFDQVPIASSSILLEIVEHYSLFEYRLLNVFLGK